jgi:hypothetical protein
MAANIQTSDAQADVRRDAIIFIPSIGAESPGQSVEGISQKICSALDTNAETPTAKFKYQVRFEKYGLNIDVKVATIIREDIEDIKEEGKAKEEPVIDVYMMDYSGALTRPAHFFSGRLKASGK